MEAIRAELSALDLDEVAGDGVLAPGWDPEAANQGNFEKQNDQAGHGNAPDLDEREIGRQIHA